MKSQIVCVALLLVSCFSNGCSQNAEFSCADANELHEFEYCLRTICSRHEEQVETSYKQASQYLKEHAFAKISTQADDEEMSLLKPDDKKEYAFRSTKVYGLSVNSLSFFLTSEYNSHVFRWMPCLEWVEDRFRDCKMFPEPRYFSIDKVHSDTPCAQQNTSDTQLKCYDLTDKFKIIAKFEDEPIVRDIFAKASKIELRAGTLMLREGNKADLVPFAMHSSISKTELDGLRVRSVDLYFRELGAPINIKSIFDENRKYYCGTRKIPIGPNMQEDY